MTVDRRTLILGATTLGATTLATMGISGTAESESPDPNLKNAKQQVLGIGGLFFRSRDPKALSEWYRQHLGIDPTPTEYNAPVWQQAAGPTVFAPFPMETKYFGSAQQAWMVNFRVRNLDAMAAQLLAAGVNIDIDAEVYPNGRFARLHDPEGNPIELWEPSGRDAARETGRR